MTTKAHLGAVTAWLSSVANGTRPVADIEDRIKDMAVMLAESLPNGAMFCTQSAIYVSMEAEGGYFPSAKRAKELLETWWAGHTPPTPLLPSAANDAGLNTTEQLMAKHWLDLHASGAKDGELAVALSVVRRYAHKAFLWLAKTHLFAEQIAKRHDWLRDETPATADERAAMPPLGPVLAGIGMVLHAPPPYAKPDPAHASPESKPPPLKSTPGGNSPVAGAKPPEIRAKPPEGTRPLGALKPDDLAKIREANPAIIAARHTQSIIAEERAREHAAASLFTDDADLIDEPLEPLTWPDE
jgi:hypothetical protein